MSRTGRFRHKRSFGYASYAIGLSQFLYVFAPTKRRFVLDARYAQGGVGLQNCVASQPGFCYTSDHSQTRHCYLLCAREIWLSLDGTDGPGQTFFVPVGKKMTVCHTACDTNRRGSRGLRRIAEVNCSIAASTLPR
jgi:hypothetical protein